jgi:hypothetical protein
MKVGRELKRERSVPPLRYAASPIDYIAKLLKTRRVSLVGQLRELLQL